MRCWHELVERARASGQEIEFYGPQGEDNIRALSESLRVTLPPSFIEFLQTYGGGGVVGEWISGIYGNQPLLRNAGTVYGDTVRCREQYGLPEELIVVYSQDDEVVWCLDSAARDHVGEHPVVSFDPFGKQRKVLVARDFSEFFEQYLRMHTLE